MPGDYGSIRFKFAKSMLPPNFNTTEWMTKLKESIKDLLINSYSVLNYQIEIESVRLKMEEVDSSTTPPPTQPLPRASHRILKRSEERLMLYVDFNILPLSASKADISMAKNVSYARSDMDGLLPCYYSLAWVSCR